MTNLDSSKPQIIALLQANYNSLLCDFAGSVQFDVNSSKERHANLTKIENKPSIKCYLKALGITIAELIEGNEANPDYPQVNIRSCIQFPNGQKITFSWEDWRDIKRFKVLLAGTSFKYRPIPKSPLHAEKTAHNYSIAREPYSLIMNIAIGYQTTTQIQADFQESYIAQKTESLMKIVNKLESLPQSNYLVACSSLSVLANGIFNEEYIDLFRSAPRFDEEDKLTYFSVTYDSNQLLVEIEHREHNLELIGYLLENTLNPSIELSSNLQLVRHKFKLHFDQFDLLLDICNLAGVGGPVTSSKAA